MFFYSAEKIQGSKQESKDDITSIFFIACNTIFSLCTKIDINAAVFSSWLTIQGAKSH